MTTRYLLDTNIASYVIKGSFPSVRRRLSRISIPQVFLSAVTEAELWYGVARRPDIPGLRTVVEDFLVRVTVLAWDSVAAQQYGQLRATLEREGQPMGNLDMMIAAHALASGCVLVTNDQAFSRIKGLKLENWAKR